MNKYKAIIYDIDGTILNTLNMNMYPLLQIIKEEAGETWSFGHVLNFAAYPSMKVMEELKIKDPEPLLKCIENLNVPKEEVIYIGDALSDQQSSINAGIDFGYAKWGSVSTSHYTVHIHSKVPLIFSNYYKF